MRTTSPLPAPFLALSRPAPRWIAPRSTRIIAGAAAAVVALAFLFAARPPGDAIRGDLASAAAALGTTPASASPARVAAVLRAALPGRALRVDPAGFPTVVAITLQGLDWQTCVAAERSARRLEGRVVVELDGYPSPEDCRDANDMTWRLMP
jgi:hypothetical protein